jgi:hypothetical protein
MKVLEVTILIIVALVSGYLGAEYRLKAEPKQKIAVLDVTAWSESLLEMSKEKGLSKEDLAVETRLLSREVNDRLRVLKEQGVTVIDAAYILTAPEGQFIDR